MKLKEELRSVVASAGHRIGIMNAYRIKNELAKKESSESLIRSLEREATIYTVKLYSSGKIPRSVVADTISWTKNIVENIVDIRMADQESLYEDSFLLNKLKNPFFTVETQYKLDKYLKENGFYVSPEEIVLGTYHKIPNINGVTKTKLAKDTLEYVPIFPLLKNILELPEVLANSFEVSSQHDALTLAFFMLAALHRPKAKKVTQGDSVKSFLDVTHDSSR
ncbi:unnamed protein product [Allacma fusca]|uniref:Uncharacterized protein n=1 Tax=Allacma fusca TaxID=39272 RepID=A0A8J2PET6_9HEXA|nr:unnamed protein product [Allacma fusca]